MADYNESILLNGFGEIGNTSGWVASGVSLINDPAYGGRHFVVNPAGHMEQTLNLTAIVKTSKTYLFKMTYFRSTEHLDPNVFNQAAAELKFVFKDGLEDFYKFPFQDLKGEWRTLEMLATMPNEVELDHIVVRIVNKESMLIRVDNMQLLPDVELVNPPSSEGGFDNYAEKSILYGLEKDMPKLGGY